MCNKYLPGSISRSLLQVLQGSVWTLYGSMYIILFMCMFIYLIHEMSHCCNVSCCVHVDVLTKCCMCNA